MRIKKIFGREILDSRGSPTVEVDLFADSGFGRASVPSGASTGKYEALELRDGGPRYHGKGVLRAVRNVNKIIAPALVGKELDQKAVDRKLIELAGENKKKLGANATLGVSIAAAKAVGGYKYISQLAGTKPRMPLPMCVLIEGGKHGGGKLEMQEFMIQPKAKSFAEGIRFVSEIYHTLEKLMEKKYGPAAKNVGFEGAFAGPIKTVEEALDIIIDAIEMNYSAGKEIFITMDPAASEFYKNKKYMGKTSGEMIDFYADLVSRYPIISLEDPLAQDDWDGFAAITKKLKIQIVGDDLFTTNIKRLEKGIKMGACNAMLLKPNQVGTVTEAVEAAKICFKNKYAVVVSHRGGETEDAFIADLAVGLGCGQIKTGAPCRGERTAKYNQLLRIEEEL